MLCRKDNDKVPRGKFRFFFNFLKMLTKVLRMLILSNRRPMPSHQKWKPLVSVLDLFFSFSFYLFLFLLLLLSFCFSFNCYWGKKFSAYSFNIFFDHYFIMAPYMYPRHTCLNKMLSIASKNSPSSGRHRWLNQHVDISVWQMPLAGCRRCYGNIAGEVRKVSRRGNIRLWCLDSSVFLTVRLQEFSS